MTSVAELCSPDPRNIATFSVSHQAVAGCLFRGFGTPPFCSDAQTVICVPGCWAPCPPASLGPPSQRASRTTFRRRLAAPGRGSTQEGCLVSPGSLNPRRALCKDPRYKKERGGLPVKHQAIPAPEGRDSRNSASRFQLIYDLRVLLMRVNYTSHYEDLSFQRDLTCC